MEINIKELLGNPIIDDWTRGFCESLLEQLSKGRTLSEKQKEIVLSKESKYSPEAIAANKSWKQSWNKAKAENFRICAMYYKRNPPYYQNVVSKVSDDGIKIFGSYIPSRKLYKSMCENKYTTRILDAWRQEPKYEVGSAVALRLVNGGVRIHGENRWSQSVIVKKGGINIPHIVVKSNIVFPDSAARGSKVYQLLPVGGTPFNIEERYIKKYRR